MAKKKKVYPSWCQTPLHQLLFDAAVDAAERAGKNAKVAPHLLFAPIMWALQDAFDIHQVQR